MARASKQRKSTPVPENDSNLVSGWKVPVAAALFGIICAHLCSRPAAVLGMPMSVFFRSMVSGPCGGDLENWLWQNGGWPNAHTSSSLKAGRPQRGLVACFNLNVGDQILYVPSKLLLRPSKTWIARSHVQEESFTVGEARGRAHALAGLSQSLLDEQALGKASIWHLWLDRVMVPRGKHFISNAASWKIEARGIAEKLLPMYMHVVEETLSHPKFGELVRNVSDASAFRTALGHVLSRLHGSDVANGDLYMAPLVDFINMPTPPQKVNARVKPSVGGMVVEATAPLEIGEEVTISYGNLPNAHLLAAYGFMFPTNGMSAQIFKLDIERSRAQFQNDATDEYCSMLMEAEAPNGNLYLHLMLGQGTIEDWRCFGAMQVLEIENAVETPVLQSVPNACRQRAMMIKASLDKFVESEEGMGELADVAVVGQLKAVAVEEMERLQLCVQKAAS